MTLDNPVTDLEAELPEGEAIAEVEQVEAEPELSITIEGEEPAEDELAMDPEIEASLGVRGIAAVTDLRAMARRRAKEARENARKVRELEQRLAAMEPASRQVTQPPKRPLREDCGYDDDLFAEKMLEYAEEKRKYDQHVQDEQAQEKAREDKFIAKREQYHQDKTKLRVDGFDDVESVVREKLPREHQSAVLIAATDPAKLIYALGRSEKLMAELAKMPLRTVQDSIEFGARVAQIEGRINVTTKTPPQPETKLRGGSGSKLPTTPSDIAKLQRVAEETGDYSAYFAAKAAMRAAGVKT